MADSLPKFDVDANISRAWSIPAPWYCEPEILRREKEKIFSRTWQVVGHRDQVCKAGDYFTTQIMGEPLLIVRGPDAKLRGFYNICRHRAGSTRRGLRHTQTLQMLLPRLDL